MNPDLWFMLSIGAVFFAVCLIVIVNVLCGMSDDE